MFKAYRRYAEFKGRSGRKEYWLFVVWMILGSFAAMCVDIALFGLHENPNEAFSPFYWVFSLVNLVPGLAVSFRRLHDTGRTAWWLLIGLIPIIGAIVLIVFTVRKGDPGPNAFGPPDGGPPPEREPIVV